jgi:hypothetical protein
LMFRFSLALVSMCLNPYFAAKSSPYFLETCLSSGVQSILFPTIILLMSYELWRLICLSQFSILLNVFRSVTEYTWIAIRVPRWFQLILCSKSLWWF